MALRVVFFGTPAFAVPTLRALAASPHTLTGVVTQPDRARGRGQHVRPEAVKQAAMELDVNLSQPERLGDGEWIEWFRSQRPDVAVVAAYGRLLPQRVLDIPRLGFLNVHASLLPRWRGAAPIHRAIIAGDEVTGVTIMRMVLKLDAGPMLAHAATPIGPEETSVDLERRLAAMGAPLLVDTLGALERGESHETPQDESAVTYAARLERADGDIRWADRALDIHNRIRGLHPWPLAAATLGRRRILLLRSRVESREVEGAAPGTIVRADPDGLVVAAGQGAVRLLDVQPEGRRAMSVRDFLNGTRVETGDVLR